MEAHTVSFFGHRRIDEPFAIERAIEKIIRDLLTKKEYVEFLIGCVGKFDQLALSTILILKSL